MARSPWLAGFAFLHTQDYLPSGCTIHSGLDPLKSIINQENAHRLAYRTIYLMEAFSQLRFPLLKQPYPHTGLRADALHRQSPSTYYFEPGSL